MYYNEKQMIKVSYLSQYYPIFKDKTVVDIGCNAGVVTDIIAQYAKKVYGIERDSNILKEADGIKWIKDNRKDNVEFINLSIGEFLKKDYKFNAAYASCVLYYLTDEEIELIETKLFPKCDLVMFVSYDIRPDLGNNKYSLGKWDNIQAFLRKNGFGISIKEKDSKWIVIIGRK